MANDNLKKLIDNYGRACVAFGTPAWESKAGEELSAALASHTGEAEPVGWQVRGIGREDGPGQWRHAESEDMEAYRNGPDCWELRPVYATPPAATPAAPGDAFTAAYMAACEGRAPDHNEIGLHYFRAGAALSNPAPVAAPAPDAYNRKLRQQLEQEWCAVRKLRRADEAAPAPASEAVASLKRLIGSAVNYPFTERSQSWVTEVYAKIDALAGATPTPGDSAEAPVQQAALQEAARETVKWLNSYFRFHDGNKYADKLSAALKGEQPVEPSGTERGEV